MEKIPDNIIKHGIVEYPKFLSKTLCDEIINTFEKNKNSHQNRMEWENIPPWFKQDTQIKDIELFNPQIDSIHKKIFNTFEQYSLSFGELHRYLNNTYIDNFKIQRTLPGEGYHVWHFEQFPHSPNRVAVWTIYLNDVEEGGETEFLYQHTRVKPKQGSLLIFPANYIFTHRGNPPLSGTKYIITGWVCFKEPQEKLQENQEKLNKNDS